MNENQQTQNQDNITPKKKFVLYTPFKTLPKSIKIGTMILFAVALLKFIPFVIVEILKVVMSYLIDVSYSPNKVELSLITLSFIIAYFLIEKLKEGKHNARLIYYILLFSNISKFVLDGGNKIMVLILIPDVIAAFFLFNKEANDFFESKKEQSTKENQDKENKNEVAIAEDTKTIEEPINEENNNDFQSYEDFINRKRRRQ